MTKFITNIFDPRLPYAEHFHCYLHGETHEERHIQWQNHLNWISKFLMGDPKASPTHTVEEMKYMGFVGLYRPHEVITEVDPSEDTPYEEDTPYCGDCGGTDLSYIDQYANGPEWRCKACGHQFIH